jgi:ATP-dependent Clp protease ATP-binding subunit ClpA
MFERFGAGPKQVVARAVLRTKADGATTLEASDLLLALVEGPSGRAGEVLAELGVDADAVRAGLQRELQGALAAVGVHDAVPPRRVSAGWRRGPFPRWGESAKLALRRALKEAGTRKERPLRNEHVLLGLVSAEGGVVPRLLAELGVSPSRIREAIG